jgi:hypothetical protein
MPDEKNDPGGFKVIDRRPFGADGSRREDVPASQKAEDLRSPLGEGKTDASTKAARQEGRTEPARSGSGTGPAPWAARDEHTREAEGLGFETLVSYLSTTAMFQLGLLAGPGGERIPPDLVNARRTVDMLEVLGEKTRGNLTEEEAGLLEEVLYELRMSYVAIQNQFTQKKK